MVWGQFQGGGATVHARTWNTFKMDKQNGGGQGIVTRAEAEVQRARSALRKMPSARAKKPSAAKPKKKDTKKKASKTKWQEAT
jgi:hypothetical protein